MSHNVYQKAQSHLAGPRNSEYLAFSKCTAELIRVESEADMTLNIRAGAVHQNQLLWDILARDCANDKNQLPFETRAAIVNLSRFVSQYSRDAVRKRESLEPLIDINRILMDGLAGRQVSVEKNPVET